MCNLSTVKVTNHGEDSALTAGIFRGHSYVALIFRTFHPVGFYVIGHVSPPVSKLLWPSYCRILFYFLPNLVVWYVFTVSYTHLDVYKRQGIDDVKQCFIYFPRVKGKFFLL